MSLFKHKKDEEAKIQLEREAIDKLNNNPSYFEAPEFYTEEDWTLSGKVKAPHTITADELNKKHSETTKAGTGEISVDDTEKNNDSPTEFLYQKMMNFRAKTIENSINNEEIKETASENTEASISVPVKEEQSSITTNVASNLGGSAEERRVTLLARCNAYLEDATDSYKINTEKYKLESVESILESFEARAAERVNKKFNINSPSLDINEPIKAPINKAMPITANSSTPSLSDTVVFSAQPTKDTEPVASAKNPEAVVKHIFTADTTPTQKPAFNDFDDISSTRIISDISSHSKPKETFDSTKTTLFPVVETIINTPPAEVYSNNEPKYEEEIELNIDDYKNITDRPRVLKSLVSKKNSFNIKFFVSLVCFLISLLIATPISGSLSLSQGAANVIDLVICLLILTVNIGALSGIKSLFSSMAKTSLPAALSILSATLFSVINLIFKGSLVGLSSIAAISLVSYNLANKKFYTKAIKNFNLIATSEFKNAVSIIQNKSATKAIVGNSIEGSALVCYGGETTNLHNFLKYTFCQNPISGKIQKISLISIIVAILSSVITFVLDSTNSIFPLYILSVTICFCAIPSVYHIVSLTVNSANKRLNHYDAMITGYKAADELELCNAVAISCDSLFPEGTVRLVDMKLLSPNPFDQSILDAAAIASAIHSPLAGIFKQMDASKAYNGTPQEVDTVIYEEKMGISGWVNDRRVFVGNRDLLIGHGFSGLPPAELDKKIMRKGYFPVYIASDNIPCALLVVKYEPDDDIVYEMQRLANTGTTILVDNCDPNINAQMLTDYFELYSETVFVMSKQGADFYKTSTQHKEHRRGGAAFKSRIEGLLATLTASINIKKYVSRMTVFYITGLVLGLLSLLTCILTSLTTFITPLVILLIQLVLTAITLLPTVLRKP